MITKLSGTKTTTFIHDRDIFSVNRDILKKLREAARTDPLGRSRLCLHRAKNDTVQEMIVALRRGFYVRPHKHVGKTESFHIIKGGVVIFFFDDKGIIREKITLGEFGGKAPYLYRLSAEFWHTAVPTTPYVIFHEIIGGPFEPTSSVFPDWAPAENDTREIAGFLRHLYTYPK